SRRRSIQRRESDWLARVIHALGGRRRYTAALTNMDLTLTSQETAFRDELRSWLAGHVPPNWEAEELHHPMQERFAFQRRWQKTVFDAGWAGVAWPRAYGGRGATLMEQAIFTEEMARAGAPPLANTLGLSLVGPTIIAFGTDAQKQRFLPH